MPRRFFAACSCAIAGASINGRALAVALLALLVTAEACAGPLRERIRERLQEKVEQRGSADADEADGLGGNAQSCADWAARVARLQQRAATRRPGPQPDLGDIAYGASPLERFDVYLPRKGGTNAAPVIVMVHGGGWCVGDKTAAGVVANKVARWTARGFVFVSLNYPMVNEGSDALAQAGHVARAVARVQAGAAEWGGDPAKVVLIGHSAGAHLVSLVNADGGLRAVHGVRPLLGTVSLDAGAIDVPRQMPQVYSFLKLRYREAFGDSEARWIAASPLHRLDARAAPWLGVCSTTRKDDPCAQARAYAAKSEGLGVRAEVLPLAMGHGAINKELGLENDYTRRIEAFMAGLDPALARLLRQ